MSTLATNVNTLLDAAKRFGPDGKPALIAELLSETNPVLQDMAFMEGNLPTGHRTTIRTGLPTVGWRLLNQGVTPSKSLVAQVDESCGILEAWSEVDQDVAELNGNVNGFRLSEARAFLEAMNQEMADTLFYGDQLTAPEEFTGFTPRYNDSSGPENAENIIDSGGTDVAAQTSIWLVVWGEQTCFGIYPKGSQAGLYHEDLGLQTIETASGIGATNGRLRAYQDHWKWKNGLVVKDWRYVVRICNLQVADLLNNSGDGTADVTANLIRAIHRVPSLAMGNAAIYCNRTIGEVLDLQARAINAGLHYVGATGNFNKTSAQNVPGGTYGSDTFMGKPVVSFRGVPIRICDAITNTEAVVA